MEQEDQDSEDNSADTGRPRLFDGREREILSKLKLFIASSRTKYEKSEYGATAKLACFDLITRVRGTMNVSDMLRYELDRIYWLELMQEPLWGLKIRRISYGETAHTETAGLPAWGRGVIG